MHLVLPSSTLSMIVDIIAFGGHPALENLASQHDFSKDVGKAFLGRDWRAMALDSSHLSALTHFGHHLPSHQFPTTKSRKPFPIFYVGISNQTSLAGLRTPRGRLRRDSEGFCGHDGRGLAGQSYREDVKSKYVLTSHFNFVYFQ